VIRSWLFVPGDHPRKIERALDSGADALIFDWEDAVGPGNKQAARDMVSTMLAQAPAQGPALFVRINAWDSEFIEDDLAALPVSRLRGVVLPKSCGPGHILRLCTRLKTLEQAAGLDGDPLQIVAVATENAASVLALSDFRQPLPRLTGLMWGAEDLAADLGVFRNRDASENYRPPFLLARNLTLMAAAASQTCAIDAVFTDFRNLSGLADECRAARLDGFGAKAAIHPDQVAVINAAFQPSAEERAWASRVIDTLGGATGVAVLDGKMIDIPHLRLARRLLSGD
jgi:citrate lyase subunit beta/citryl-CoA lyase